VFFQKQKEDIEIYSQKLYMF